MIAAVTQSSRNRRSNLYDGLRNAKCVSGNALQYFYCCPGPDKRKDEQIIITDCALLLYDDSGVIPGTYTQSKVDFTSERIYEVLARLRWFFRINETFTFFLSV